MTYDQLVARGKHVVETMKSSVLLDRHWETECYSYKYDELSTLAPMFFGVDAEQFHKDTGYYTKED